MLFKGLLSYTTYILYHYYIEKTYLTTKQITIISKYISLERIMELYNQSWRTKLTCFKEGYNAFFAFFVTKTLFVIMESSRGIKL